MEKQEKNISGIDLHSPQILSDAEKIYSFMSDVPALPDSADIILAAGSYDLRVAEHAAELYLKGYAPLVVCSGGFGKLTSGLFQKPEAELFAQRCIELGVPESDIIAERNATNTGENFTCSRELLERRGIRPVTGIIACKPYMAKRTWATGTKQWPEVIWFAAPMTLPLASYPTELVSLEETIQLMVGDLQRMSVYESRGFQVHVDVPDGVRQAYERLVKAGFDRYVIR